MAFRSRNLVDNFEAGSESLPEPQLSQVEMHDEGIAIVEGGDWDNCEADRYGNGGRICYFCILSHV